MQGRDPVVLLPVPGLGTATASIAARGGSRAQGELRRCRHLLESKGSPNAVNPEIEP